MSGMTIKSPFAGVTIIARNYLPFARVLAKSFKNHHPESDFYIVIIDHPQLLSDSGIVGCKEVGLDSINFEGEPYEYMATIYNVTEFATSVKPFVLRHFLSEHEVVFYIDPDIKIFGRLDKLVDATSKTGVSLTPHCLKPMARDGNGPSEREIMQAGIYNLGFCGVSKLGKGFLDWWCERLRRDALIDPNNHLFTDQRWVDFAPSLFDVHIEKSSSYNVAYWNLDQRTIWRSSNGKYMIDDETLKFFHFSGFSPGSHLVSKYQPTDPRVTFETIPELVTLYGDYEEEYVNEKAKCGDSPEYGFKYAFIGQILTDRIRRQYRHELIKAETSKSDLPPCPFITDEISNFRKWLSTHDGVKNPLKEKITDSAIAVSKLARVLQQLVDHRQDHSVFASRFKRSSRNGKQSSDFQIIDCGTDGNGIDVIGYLTTESGVGQAGRNLLSGVEKSGLPFTSCNIQQSGSRATADVRIDNELRNRIAAVAVNADQFGHVIEAVGSEYFKDRYVIGQWFWEVEDFPKHLKPAFGYVNEIWAPTRHIKKILEAHSPAETPITYMPLSFNQKPRNLAASKEKFGFSEDFMFLFVFDFLSVFNRKNPLAVIDAYIQQFRSMEKSFLVIKTINGHHRPEQMEMLKVATRSRSDILIIDGYFDSELSSELIGICDCYVSLHRAEGLGLTMLEAMSFGKPVIATNYSGNCDFMDDQNAFLVPYELTRIGQGSEPYAENGMWAQPDATKAAECMRNVFENRTESALVGENAIRSVESLYDPVKIGNQISLRLAEVLKTL